MRLQLTYDFALLLWLLLLVCSGSGPHTHTAHAGRVKRAIGGAALQPGEMPWLASIRFLYWYGPYRQCTASLIHERFLLTAAHCVFDNERLLTAIGSPYGKWVARVGSVLAVDPARLELESNELALAAWHDDVHQVAAAVRPQFSKRRLVTGLNQKRSQRSAAQVSFASPFEVSSAATTNTTARPTVAVTSTPSHTSINPSSSAQADLQLSFAFDAIPYLYLNTTNMTSQANESQLSWVNLEEMQPFVETEQLARVAMPNLAPVTPVMQSSQSSPLISTSKRAAVTSKSHSAPRNSNHVLKANGTLSPISMQRTTNAKQFSNRSRSDISTPRIARQSRLTKSTAAPRSFSSSTVGQSKLSTEKRFLANEKARKSEKARLFTSLPNQVSTTAAVLLKNRRQRVWTTSVRGEVGRSTAGMQKSDKKVDGPLELSDQVAPTDKFQVTTASSSEKSTTNREWPVREIKRREVYSAERSIIRILVHPKYNQPRYHNDVALLVLNRPVQRQRDNILKFMRLTTIPHRHDKCVFAGWGCKAWHAPPEIHAQKVTFKVHSADVCHSVLNHFTKENQICAGSLGDEQISICDGDSGGPLVCWYHDQWKQIGVASYVSEESFSPGVFENVSVYSSWITQTIEKFERGRQAREARRRRMASKLT